MADSNKLLTWYNDVYSRTVDLVGDYAGSELFIIEGDSLLLHCLTDDQLHFSSGFQLLHATYIVERFLANLRQRNCNFQIVFFSEHSVISIPPHVDKASRPKYSLAREAILQHLLQNAPDAVPSVRVKCFNRYDSQEFREYLAAEGVYFLMCHDGALMEHNQHGKESVTVGDNENLRVSGDSDFGSEGTVDGALPTIGPTSAILRSMICWFIAHGYNISLLNSVECRDTKVFTTVLEGSAENAQNIYHARLKPTGDPESSEPDTQKLAEFDTKTVHGHIKAHPIAQRSLAKSSSTEFMLRKFMDIIGTTCHHVTQREWVSVLTASTVLNFDSFEANDMVAICALLLHTVILSECKLSDRTYSPTDCTGELFLVQYAEMARDIITSPLWHEAVRTQSICCDLADLMDGRLFLQLLELCRTTPRGFTLSQSVLTRFSVLTSLVKYLCGSEVSGIKIINEADKKTASGNRRTTVSSKHLPNDQKEPANAVLPFNNPVFDPHLRPISLVVDESATEMSDFVVSRTFEEMSHWHNHKRPLDKRNEGPMPEKLLRRNQFFMAEITKYAASLTNAAGGILEPETVFLKPEKHLGREPIVKRTIRVTETPRNKQLKVNGPKQGSHQKMVGSLVKNQATIQVQEKQHSAGARQLKAWGNKCQGFEKETSLTRRYLKAREYLVSLEKEKRYLVEVEVLTYQVSTLVQLWKKKCASNEQEKSLSIVALIWYAILQISKAKQGITDEVGRRIQDTINVFNLPAIDISPNSAGRLSFEFTSLASPKVKLETGLSPVEFQLIHAGPYFDRNMDSAPDARVHDFEPDRWQREILDQIDAKASLFVVAPTSAGKTFISFYAMKQILEDSNDGVLVYVAPTKALVNQIAAEVQARFSKSFKHVGKSVWAIHTRDYRINDPAGCQVLITVPHILQIMLLAPSNARSWSSRVKRIIFDEVHCIGQAEDGVVWEQLLLLAPCPIIALSATVGNPEEFKNWLSLTQKANGCDLKMIEHKARWSDLRKFKYNPPQAFVFKGLPNVTDMAALGLDGCPNMSFIHPVTSLINRSRGIPDDLTLEPRDCWSLWKAMDKYKTNKYPLDRDLDPSVALPTVISKTNVLEWEAKLKTVLKSWLNNLDSPFNAVLEELSPKYQPDNKFGVQISTGVLSESETPRKVRDTSILDTTLPLICSLHDQGALPALFFNYDRSWCEKICQEILSELQESEAHWKASSSAWTQKIAEWETWKKVEAKRAKQKLPTRKTGKGESMSKEEQMRDMTAEESSWHESFDPEEPDPRFSLADMKKLAPSEFEDYAEELRRREVPQWLIDALKRGIGVHHAGMNRKYRQACEILFRKGYLRVVIATGTLALGINMPCKTVVFSGDSVFLTALGFRQAAGRAGRRGFDFLGNVVFQCISHSKVCRLLSSKLPSLNGHFPITTSLVLRLFILLQKSEQAPFAVKAINSILSCPRIYLGGPDSKHTVLHHLRFSIEYLRRNYLLDTNGLPLNFAGTVAHLYYTENSSFAFHALLNDGYFHRLCKNISSNPNCVVLTLMLVMSHLFGRQYLRPSILERLRMSEKKPTSVVVLPSLPKHAAEILRSHNKKTLEIYSSYVTTFVEQHVKDPDCFLPLTQIKCGGDKSPDEISCLLPITPPTRVTSSFVALSGHKDEWRSISDLSQKVRSGVWLEWAVVPYVGLFPEEGKFALNAYLYDFFKHGNVEALEKENIIRRGDIWFVLNDFSLVLATIVTSFENYLKLSNNTDMDLLDVAGSGDNRELSLEDDAVDTGQSSPGKTTKTAGRISATMQSKPKTPISPGPSARPKKSKVADSWEDELSDEDPSQKDDEISKGSEKPIRTTNQLKGKGKNNVASAQRNSDSRTEFNEMEFLQVLQAFKMLQAEFNAKFKAMWA
ncbi:DEAD/DEAH box helicase [Aspergillus sclerotioniger CBS 115572]|uniref:DEAD/DEAH box helicase n=1 Tax=Aspergillus sclerotioniger CBS 115572 TaxID=1450535 RepID=A0A317X868_9EURO|nr:DEAD/DEAH box helicase [Aspergillus sclerotioniger CBS 115572]PWY93852.1 DEAD/DEAH box helicase [Aspergillus sclerotioniger CBS 115572]